MTYQTKQEDNELIYTFSGRMDTVVCMDIKNGVQEEVDRLINEKGSDGNALKVIFNLGEVNYIASSFLRLCSAVAQKVEHANFEIINSNPSVRKVFKIAGLDNIIKIK